MIELNQIKHIYFLGIGGIGMSALASHFIDRGVQVYGYDRNGSPITTKLEKLGADIHYDLDASKISSNLDLIVYTPAIKEDNLLFQHLQSMKAPMIKRSDMLAIMAQDLVTIAVAGTHGKTTITSMLSHIFKVGEMNFIGFVGGVMKNYNSNLISHGQAEYAIIEADEFDRSFLKLSPHLAIISSVDPDHLDIYEDTNKHLEGFEEFVAQIQDQGIVYMNENVQIRLPENAETVTYGFDAESGVYASNIRNEGLVSTFDVVKSNEVIKDFELHIPGWHNILNMTVAIAVAQKFNISESVIRKAVSSYMGVIRRFDVRYLSSKTIYIDDYAHHPEEINALLSSVRQLFPKRKITAIFQPHLYSRTRDFAKDFAKSLSLADQLIILDIYPAREKPIQGIDSQMILDLMPKEINKRLSSKTDILKHLENMENDIILSIGAGDIDQLVAPIEEWIKMKAE